MSDKAFNMEPNPEPSMEEILASIKRVINEDKRPGARGRGEADGSNPGPPDDDILELNAPVEEGERLLSDESAAATRQSLATLAAVRQQHPGSQNEGPLEAAVKEMLRPMLKQWLDERLPQMIEDIVAREISRITGQRF
jgi:cell pole-organizing protein PopZ